MLDNKVYVYILKPFDVRPLTVIYPMYLDRYEDIFPYDCVKNIDGEQYSVSPKEGEVKQENVNYESNNLRLIVWYKKPNLQEAKKVLAKELGDIRTATVKQIELFTTYMLTIEDSMFELCKDHPWNLNL